LLEGETAARVISDAEPRTIGLGTQGPLIGGELGLLIEVR